MLATHFILKAPYRRAASKQIADQSTAPWTINIHGITGHRPGRPAFFLLLGPHHRYRLKGGSLDNITGE